MIVTAIYAGDRLDWEVMNLKGKEQRIAKHIRIWNDIRDDKGIVIAKYIETNDAKTYEEAHLQKWQKYTIKASEVTKDKIVRPSVCERVLEEENCNQAIQDVITQYKSDFIFRDNAIELLSEFSQKSMINYILTIVDKSKNKTL